MWSLLLASTAEAVTLSHVPDLVELRDQSRAVVTGVVTERRTERASYGLVTTWSIAVERTLAGVEEDEVTVRLPGGREGELVQSFAQVPRWTEGDEVLVFVPREGERQSLAGVFTLDGDRVLDPLERWAVVPSLAELEQAVRLPIRAAAPR